MLAVKSLFLILIFFFGCSLRVHCQPTTRDCSCSQKYSLTKDTPIPGLGADLATITENEIRDTCEFKCARTCSENIRQLVGGDPHTVTPLGQEKMCQDVAPNRSVIKDGISLWNYWKLEPLCFDDRVRLEENVCCVHCECKLAYYRAGETIPPLDGGRVENLTAKWNLSEAVFTTLNEGKRAFKCDKLEHDRVCEEHCRREIASLTENKLVNDRLEENR
jgi:hypothetical protein